VDGVDDAVVRLEPSLVLPAVAVGVVEVLVDCEREPLAQRDGKRRERRTQFLVEVLGNRGTLRGRHVEVRCRVVVRKREGRKRKQANDKAEGREKKERKKESLRASWRCV
jgi:hypothetical protein